MASVGQTKHTAVSSSRCVPVHFDGSCAHLPLLLLDCHTTRASVVLPVYVTQKYHGEAGLFSRLKKNPTKQNGACHAGSWEVSWHMGVLTCSHPPCLRRTQPPLGVEGGSVLNLTSNPLTKGSSPALAFLPFSLKPSAEDQNTNQLYPVYCDHRNSNATKRKEN